MNYIRLALFIVLVGDSPAYGKTIRDSSSQEGEGSRQLQANLKHIAIGRYTNNGNQLLINDGSGGFSPLSVPGEAGRGVAAGDFDNDGYTDLVLGNEGGLSGQSFIVNGNGFTDTILVEGELSSTTSVAVGDFNGDGNLDIVLGTDWEGTYLALNPSFTSSIIPGAGYGYVTSLAVGDMNNDGVMDIVIGSYHEQNELLINDGSGVFSISPLPGASQTEIGDELTQSVAIGDMNGDGLMDIVLGNYNRENQLLINNGDGSFTPSILPGGSFVTYGVAVGDMNNDGVMDIVVGNYNAYNQLLVGPNYFSFNLPGGTLNTRSIAVGDVDGDGFIDIVIGNDGDGQKNQLLINNNGELTFSYSDLPGEGRYTNSVAVLESPLCSVNQYVASHVCTTCPAGKTNAAGDVSSGSDTSCDTPTASPTDVLQPVGPWEINFLEMTENFDFDSTRQVNMTYEIGTGHEYEAILFDVDCATPVSTPDVMTVDEILEEEGGIFEDSVDYDFVTLSYNVDKSKLVGSSIWNDSLNQIQFCQVFQLKEGTFVVEEDDRKVVIDFDFTASFLAENQALGAASANSETGSAGVNSYVEAYKCGAGANGMDATTSALVKNDDLVVCIRSKSADVEIVSLDAMTIDGSDKNRDESSLPVIVNSAPSSSFTSMLYVSSTEVQVLTRVPVNEFDFNADAAFITISGGVTAELSGRSLRAQFGKGPSKNKDKVKVKGGAFKLDIALQPEAAAAAVEEDDLWATSMSVSTAVYVSVTKCSTVFGMLIAYFNTMW